MTYLEMSRDEDHGGGSWAFKNCLWAPIKKKDGAEWPFWNKVGKIREGDVVFHLRGISPEAYFVWYSIAARDGFQTSRRPPNAGDWGFAEAFFRADLTNFTQFHRPVKLVDIFEFRSAELNSYFDINRGANR